MFRELPLEFGSTQEERVYKALVKYEIPFDYQFAVYGYYNLRGAIVIDFLVWNPFSTAVEIYGKYWHSGQLGANDRYKLAVLKQMFENRVVIFYEDELETQEEADAMVRKWLVLNAGTSKE